MNILGISAFYHDSAAVLCRDGQIVVAVQEERFTRVKAHSVFPSESVNFCLSQLRENEKIDIVAYYDNPLMRMERKLINAGQFLLPSVQNLNEGIKKMFAAELSINQFLESCDPEHKRIPKSFPVYVCSHHISHAASAFYPSPFRDAAILTIDGMGEWDSTCIGEGVDNRIRLTHSIKYPHSLGLFYSAFTYYCGFAVNFDEYKLMGLAPYGKPIYESLFRDKLIDIMPDGSFRLNIKYFSFPYGDTMTDYAMEDLLQHKRRERNEPITLFYANVAASVQAITEKIIFLLAKNLRVQTTHNKLCFAGGVALNCVANGKLRSSNIFDDIWIQPASGDAGGALGAALHTYYSLTSTNRKIQSNRDSLNGAFLGPEYTSDEIDTYVSTLPHKVKKYTNIDNLSIKIAELIRDNKIIGLFHGRMEFGPRALGNRSIIARATTKGMQFKLNRSIKFRESFRPFAAAVLREDITSYFRAPSIDSPYMLEAYPISVSQRTEREDLIPDDEFEARLANVESSIPAVTHVDFSSRIQTVSKDTNEFFASILYALKKLTGESIVVNTSFNVKDEPIVCSPVDAYRCFLNTDMDVLVLDSYIIEKI